MIQRVLVVLFTVLSTAFPVVAWAQNASGAPDIVVQGTKTGTPLDQLTSAVTIIDETTIRDMRVPTVLEVLRQVEGLDVVQSGGPGGQTSLFLRGGESDHVLVVIDGVKVNSPTTGAFDGVANLTVDQIERIEVLRGAQSPLYGSEAVAGVVNIITKRAAKQDHDTARIEGGAYRTWRGTVTHSARGPVWDQALSVSRWISRGFSSADENLGNTEPDGYANTSFSMKVGRPTGVGGRTDLTLRLTDATADIDDYPPPTYQFVDFPAKQRTKAAVAGLTIASPLSARWDHRLTIGWSRDHGTTSNTANGDTDIDAQSRQVDWQHTLGIGADNLLSVGYEYQTRMADVAGSDEHRLVTNSVYIQDQLAAFDPLFVTIGGRTDDNNRFGRHNTYKAGTSLKLASWHSRVFGNYGTGFRGPTLNDLYYPGFSNPNLRPEESAGSEIGLSVDAIPGVVSLDATRFRTHYDNLIGPGPANIDSADVVGFELSSTWTVSARSSIAGNYTVTNATDGSDGSHLLKRPHNKGNLVWTFHPDPMTDFRIDYRWIGSRLDTPDGFTVVPLPHYALVNIAATERISPTTETFIRIDNFLNRDYEEVPGYGTPGRSVFAGLTTKF